MCSSFFKNWSTLFLIFALATVSVANAQEIRVIDNKGTIETVRNNQITTSATAPANPLEGDVWFDNSIANNIITKIWDGDSIWKIVGGISSDVDNQLTTGTDNGAYFNGGYSATVKNVTANYTLLASDNGSVITVNSATDVNLTIPAGFDIGYNVSVYQIGDGKVTFVESGTTIKNRLSRFKTAGKDAGVGIIATATNIFHITGDLKR